MPIKTTNLLQPYGVIFDIMSDSPDLRQASRCAMRTYSKHLENKQQAKIIFENIALLDKQDIDDRMRGAEERRRLLFVKTKEAILFMLDIADLTFNDLYCTIHRMSGFGSVDRQYMQVTLHGLFEDNVIHFDKEEECWKLNEGVTVK